MNHGLIEAPDGHGIAFLGAVQNETTAIFNDGTIDVAGFAIFRESMSSDILVLVNDGLISGATAYGQNGFLFATDLITNTGQIIGGIFLNAGNDSYNGAQGRLTGTVFGEDGNDVIRGGIDNDVFLGGDGNDILRGGLGRDRLTGGADRDFFDFNSRAEAGKGANRDKIMDFKRAQNDRIDLEDIDAKGGVSGNNAFKFIGKDDFSDRKGELRYEDKGSTVIVQGDTNGDGKADFEIFVNVGALAKGDFIL